MRRVLLVLLVLIPVAASAQKEAFRSAVELVPDQPVSGVISLSGSAPYASEYTLEVGPDVFQLELAIEDSPTDLDIELSLDYLSGYRAESLFFNEQMILSRTSDPYLETGRATIRVLYQFEQPPAINGVELTEIPFTLIARTREVDERVGYLRLGDSVSGVLEPDNGMVDIYRVRVPRGAEALRLDISGTDGDLDLFAFEQSVSANPFLAQHYSQSIRSTETLVISSSSLPALRTGTYYVMVLDQVSLDAPVEYELHASASLSAPATLLELPELDLPTDPLERALLATVEILTPDGGGSGCMISADGYLITNWHVVEGLDGKPETDITVGFSSDHTRPPAETFRAEVVAHAPDRDLALLRITSGRYGQSLPSDIKFPFHEINSQPLDIAAPLQFIGYPWIGGTGSRASITYTRGSVAGFQRTSFGLLIKSDGEINPGNSGGAALDSSFRLIGFPSSIVGENAGQLAYVVPVAAIPPAWLSQME